MKKASKSIALVMALVMALGTMAIMSFAADKVYSHPKDVYTLEGGHSEDSAKLIAVGEIVYSSIEAEDKAVYKIDSTKKQILTLSFESAAPVNVTVATSGAEDPVFSVTNQTKLSSNIDVESAYYYITVENYVAPVVDEPTTDEPTTGEGEGNEGGEDTTPPPQPDAQADEPNEFFFSTSVPGMVSSVKIDVNYSTAKIVAGDSLQLKLSNSNVPNINFFWRVIDDPTTTLVDESTIVTVSKDGLVSVMPNSTVFNKDTTVKVQAVMYYNGSDLEWTKTCTITAVPGNVFLSPAYDTTEDNCLIIGEGASRYITATTNVKDANVTWSTENAEIATVTAGGKVTGTGVGKTYLKASVKIGDVTVSRRVLVDVRLNYVSVMGISFDTHSETVRQNDYKVLKYSFTTAPEGKNPTNAKVVFTSSNPEIATVDADGKVTGVAVGTATITATSDDGKYTDTCTITVDEPIPDWLMLIIAPFRIIYNLIMMIIGR